MNSEPTEGVPTCVACGAPIERCGDYGFKSALFCEVYADDGVYRCTRCTLRQTRMDRVNDARLGTYYQKEYREIAQIGTHDSSFIFVPRAASFVALAHQMLKAPPRRIFEVGAGYGINLSALGEAFPEAELLTDEVDATIDRPERVRTGQLSDGSFDLILMSHVLEHFSDPLAILGSVRDALAPGGTLIIEVPNETDAAMEMQPFHEPHLLFFEPASLRSLISRFFDDADCFTVGPPANAGGQGSHLRHRIKQIARATPIVRSILNWRRSHLVTLDFTERRENGSYLRITVRLPASA